MSFRFSRVALFLLVVGTRVAAADNSAPSVLVGTAKIDITPEFPIRLSGYQGRPAEATRADTPLYARALAIGSNAEKPALLIAVELIGIGEETSNLVAAALREKHGIERARIAICATHVH